METFSTLLVKGIGRWPVDSPKKASDAKLWCLFYLPLDKRLSKQPRRWWFDAPSRILWRHCNVWNQLCVIQQPMIKKLKIIQHSKMKLTICDTTHPPPAIWDVTALILTCNDTLNIFDMFISLDDRNEAVRKAELLFIGPGLDRLYSIQGHELYRLVTLFLYYCIYRYISFDILNVSLLFITTA